MTKKTTSTEETTTPRRTLGAGVVEPEFAPKTGLGDFVTVNEAREANNLPPLTLGDGSPDPDGNRPITEADPKLRSFGDNPPLERGAKAPNDPKPTRFDSHMAEIDSLNDMGARVDETNALMRREFAHYFGNAWQAMCATHMAKLGVAYEVDVRTMLDSLLAPVREFLTKEVSAFEAAHGVVIRTRLVLTPTGDFRLSVSAFMRGCLRPIRVSEPAGSVRGPRGQIFLLEDAAKAAAGLLVRALRNDVYALESNG